MEDRLAVLMAEYSEQQTEIRDLLKSMDSTLQVGVVLLAAIMAGAAQTKNLQLLMLIPSMLFIFSVVHLLKVASTKVHGSYCELLADRIRSEVLGEGIVFQWEQGKNASDPLGAVQVGFYLLFAALAAIFAPIAVYAYTQLWWTAIVHVAEFVTLAVYAYFATTARFVEPVLVTTTLSGAEPTVEPALEAQV